MKKKQIEDILENKDIMKQKTKPSIRKSSLAPPGINPNRSMYNPPSLETNITTFNVINPGAGTGNAIMSTHNPSLLAISKRAKSTVRPKVKPNINFPSVTRGVTSLLSQKPLSDLPEPTKEYFEKSQKIAELEKKSLSFNEDPIAYFSKRKDGRGHLFIYLKYKKSRKDPDFSPYELVKVPFSDVGKDYFTMSASGVTHIDEFGNTENMTLDRWAKEESIYLSIMKLKTFRLYFFWKPLQVWRNFVKKMHFQEKLSLLVKQTFFYHISFSKVSATVGALVSTSDMIITKYLLPFEPSKKYTIFDFNQYSQWNFEELTKQYKKMMDKVTEIVNNLYLSIDDPNLLHVDDSDFKEITRKNPNITNLMILEQKKENERISRSQKMETEITAMTGFIRMLDYLLLESLRRSCYESYKNADLIVSSDLSAIFTIEVSFSDDGDIVFTPNKEEMLNIIDNKLDQALNQLESLPRLIQMQQLREIFIKSGINISDLFQSGPNLRDILDTAPNVKDATNHIKEVISNAYEDAYNYSQNLVYFYPLFKVGKNWDVRDFIKKRNGQDYTGTIHFAEERDPNESNDAFLLNSQDEPVINFESTEKIIQKLRSEALKVEEIRLGTVRGPLYIDSKKLKAELTPISSRSIKSLETTFSELVSTKITMLNSVLQSFSAKMNQDPNSLDLYVEFSHIVQKTSELLPQMETEIKFIDDAVNLFDRVKFSLIKNPLHTIFDKFKSDQKKALQIREKLEERFVFVLGQLVKKKSAQIQSYKESSLEIPKSTKDLDLENFFKQILKLKNKCETLEEPIEKMKFQQKVLNLKMTSFKDFDELKQNIAFSEKIYQVTKHWENLNNQIISIPFAHISMTEFSENVNEIQAILDELKETWKKPSPILDEISTLFSKISPYVKQLTELSNGRMHIRHWENLFELCNHKGEYSISVTIQTMLDYGILENEEMINEITKTSISESQFDTEFQAISAHWADVTVPFIDQQTKADDQLLLGDLSNLLNDIKSTSYKLNKMLSNRFVKGIQKQVQKLMNAMILFMKIFDQWQIFQRNWTTISTLFNQKVVRRQLPHQTTRFEIIQKKWQDIVQHSRKDNKIFKVCFYQNMLEDFIESNKSLEIILEGITEYLDSKRELIPRLYFLSNQEVLSLLSTKDFAVFTKQITKVMMKIQRLDFHTSDEDDSLTESARESSNFIGLKIFGVVGDDGDSLPFANGIQCPGPVDHWIPQIFDMMEKSTEEALSISLARFTSSSLTDWAMTVSCSIAMLTLQISFARDVEDCFNNIETNPRSFAHFEQKMKHQIHDLIDLMSSSLSQIEQWKISFFLGVLLNHYECARSFQEKISSFSHLEAWHDMIKFKYDPTNANIVIVVGDNCWTRGNEYWGSVPRLIFTPGVQNALLNLFVSNENNQIPLVFSSSTNGKSRLLEIYNYILGRFCYTASPFPDMQPHFIEQLMIGAALEGCSLIFKNIDQFPMNNQVKIFDLAREMSDVALNDSKSFKINDESNEIKIHPNFSIMFSATEKYSTDLTPQLRDYVRPIALSIIDIRKLTEASLFSSGFKTAKTLSVKLDDFTKTVLSLFNMNPTRVKHIIQIVIDGHRTLVQLKHKTKVEGADFFKEQKKAEKYAISRAAYNHFKILIDPEKQDLLIVLLFSTFHLFDDIEVFSNSLISSNNFYIDKAREILKINVENSIKELKYEVPADYLLLQAESLMEMMLSYQCIIIHGPPNSGKSLIVDLLSNAFTAMINDGDLMNQYRGLMQFKIDTIYHQSNSYNNIFGTIIQDDLMKNKWINGLFQSTIANLEQFSKTHHQILRFDGVLTPELDKFCCQFVSNPERFKLNNLGSFNNDNCFHCIIETDDISNISPRLLNSSAVLNMNSVQYSRDFLKTNIDLLQPSIPFSIIRKEFGNKFNEVEYSTILQVFGQVASVFVKKFQIDLSINCCRYCLNYLIDNEINCMNENLLLIVMAISFYTCYCSYSTDSHIDFSNWTINQFSLNIPSNWDEENEIPSAFTDYFAKPTLENIIIKKDKIVPIETSFLNEKIIVEKCKFADDILIPNVQHLSAYSTFKIAMKPHSHIFLNGPLNSGKNALLKFIFSKNEDIIPVFFNVSTSKGCSIRMVINKIRNETTLMDKTFYSTTKPKIYALIFNDLPPENIHVAEFLRQLIDENKIVLTSKIDTNYYDTFNIDPERYFIIVRSESINFEKRFLNHFLFIHTEKYTHNTKMYIVNKAMNALNISTDTIQLLVYIFEKLNYSLSEMINSFIIFANINVNPIDTIRVLMTSIYFNRFNIEKEDKFDSFIEEVINDSLKFPTFQDGIFHFKREKIFARSIQNVTNEVLTIDRNKVKEFMSNELNSSIYNESVYNFVQIDHSIGLIGHNCVIYSSTASSQMTLLKLVCKFQDSVLFEVTDISSIKEFISKLIDDDGKHVHILVIRKISNSLCTSIMNIFMSFIFYSIYNEDEIIEISKKAFNLNKNDSNNEEEEAEVIIDQEIKQKLFDKMKELIRFNCRIAFLPNQSFDDENEDYVKDLIKDFDVINLVEPSKHSICCDLIQQDEENLENVLTQISDEIQKYLPYSNITQFYDFVSSFVQYMSIDMKNHMSKNKEIKNALDFLQKLTLEKSVISEKLNQIHPDLAKLENEAEVSRSSYQTKIDVISMRKLKLDEEKKHLSANLDNKIEEMKQAESDMEQLVPNVEIAFGRVKELRQTDIDPIRITESDPCDSLKLMLEAIGVLIGVSNTSYETFGRSLLMDEQFVKRIVDNVNYRQITSVTYDKLISYINNEKLSKKELEEVAPILVILRDLLEAICAYSARNNIYREKKLQVEMTKRTLSDFIIDMEGELNSIHDIEIQLEEEQKNLMELQAKYNGIQKQYEEIEKQKNKIDSILENDSKLKEFWSTKVDSASSGYDDIMIGDSILMSVYITYAGMLDIEQRRILLEIAQTKINESSLTTSFSSQSTNFHDTSKLQSIYSNDEFIDKTDEKRRNLWFAVTSRLIAEGITNQNLALLPRSALVDFKHLEILKKIPLVIDPDRVFIELFQNEQIMIISLLSSSFTSALMDAISKGKRLIITDVNEFDQRIINIISYNKTSAGEQITIDQKTIVKHENFKVILVSSLSEVEQIPEDLQLRVTTVNISSSSIETIHTEIVNLFVDYFAPSLMPKIIELQRSELAHHVQVKQYELELLNCISKISTNFRNDDSGFSYLDDDETIERLLKNKALFFEATSAEESSTEIKKELENVTHIFKPLISIVETFWICIARYLPKVKSYYRFSFKSMVSIIKDVFSDSDLSGNVEITDDQMDNLRKNMISKLLKWLYPKISFNDSLFFLFISAFMLKDGDWSDLASIIQNLSNKMNSKLTFQSQSDSNVIEKLKDCEICDFFNLVKTFISSYFGDKFENDYPIFSIDSVIPTFSHSPSFIINDPNSKENGPLTQILKYVKDEGKMDGFECLSLTDDDLTLAKIKFKIQTSFNRGNWLLLNYSKASKKAASLINDVLYLTATNPVHGGFKLFVNCYTTEFISSQLLMRSNIVTMNDFPSIRANMLRAFKDNSQLLDSVIVSSRNSGISSRNTSSKIIKRLFYTGSLVFSQIKSRSFLSPLGFDAFYGLDASSFEVYVKYALKFAERYNSSSSQTQEEASSNSKVDKLLSARAKSILEAKKDPEFELPIRNLREFVEKVCFGSTFVETQDRRRVRALFAHFFSPSLFNDNFTYVDKNLPKASLFDLPNDAGVSSIVRQIESCWSTFDATEALMIDAETAEPLMNWNLSKWAAKPFLSILKGKKEIEEEEDDRHSIEEIIEIEEKPLSPLLKFWLNEILAFNNDVKKGLKKLYGEVKNNFSSFEKFADFMVKRRNFLIAAYSEVTVKEISLKYLNDACGFFNACKLNYCFFNNVSSDEVSIEFDFNSSDGYFTKIVDLHLFNGSIKNGLLVPMEKGQIKNAFSQIPPIFMSIGKKVERSKFFTCPLFKNVFVRNQTFNEGETNNFIIEVILNSSKGDKIWLLNSTALYVFVPDIFQ